MIFKASAQNRLILSLRVPNVDLKPDQTTASLKSGFNHRIQSANRRSAGPVANPAV
jgi:hypothetical protein